MAEPEEYEILLERGIRLGEQKAYKEALAALAKVVEMRPDDPEAHYNLGVLYGTLAAEAINPTNIFEGAEADILDEEIWTEKAIFEYQAALDLDPDNYHALNNIATLYALRQETDLAIDTLKRSLEKNPHQEDIAKELEELESI